MENGETIEVYISVFDPTNTLGVFYINICEDKENEDKKGIRYTYFTIDGVIEVYSDDMVSLFDASYLVVDDRLRLRFSKIDKEKFGIDYLYLDLVKAYELPE
jgi:hypothetical protein